MTVRGSHPSLSLAFVCFSESKGGLELMLVRIATAMARKGHKTIFICPDGSPLHDECQKAGVPSSPLFPSFKYLDFRAARSMSALYKARSVDVAIVGNSKDVSTSVIAKILHGSSRLVYVQQMQSGLDKRDIFHRWTYSRLDRWVTLTRAMKEQTIRTTIIPPQIIDVIPFGADLARFRPRLSAKAQARRVFHLSQRRKIIAVLGRFDPQKGQEYLLRAAPFILKKQPTAHFALIGEETRGEQGYLQHLRSIVRDLQLSNHVQFLPFTEEVPRLLCALDLVVLPSHSETFGYLAVEAMAMGLPVVGTNAGGLPEIIEEGKTGFLVPPQDSMRLGERIVQILENATLYRSMSRLGRQRVLQLFDFGKNVDAFEAVLTDLIR